MFFKGIRYHGENETILVQTGYITWRYWYRSVKSAYSFRDTGGTRERFKADTTTAGHGEDCDKEPVERVDSGDQKDEQNLPHRIEVVVHGLEWFVYNRSAAYDSILSGFGHSNSSERNENPDSSNKETEIHTSAREDDTLQYDGKNSESITRVATESHQGARRASGFSNSQDGGELSSTPSRTQSATKKSDETSVPSIISLLPLSVISYKGAVVVGNENAKSIFTVTFEKAVGKIDAQKAGTLDLYKQVFEFDLSHPVIQLKPNPDYKQSQLAAANGIGSETLDAQNTTRKPNLQWRYNHHRRKIWTSVRDLIPYFQRSVESFNFELRDLKDPRPSSARDLPRERSWLGLSRYLDEEDQDEHEGWSSVEYGRYSTLVDCPDIGFAYYWDVPGKVENSTCGIEPLGDEQLQNGTNDADPPAWGMDLAIKGGMINYGPWADRERANLQSIFFPNSYRDSQPSQPLKPGEMRQSPRFKLQVQISEATTLRIPIRESSKDWTWKGRANAVKGVSRVRREQESNNGRGVKGDKGGNHGPDIRPFGWFSLQIDKDSTIEYMMDMFASTSGYKNQLNLDLRKTRVTSSVNHGLFWQCERQAISCDLSNPLEWNSLHCWSIDAKNSGMELFMLRDHMFLLTDLIADWTSGPSPEYFTFVPFRYNIGLSFDDFRLHMNVNDSNIINNPADLDDNAFLIIEGQTLAVDLEIPMTDFRPNRNTVNFDVQLLHASMRLSTPLWNTQRSFLREPTVADLDDMTIRGSYAYHLSTSPALTDVLTIFISGTSPKLYMYGFMIRYFLNVKENFFGDCLHFKTLEEFQDLSANPDQIRENSSPSTPQKSNGLDVILHVSGSNPRVILPGNLYDRVDCLSLRAASFDADVRFTNYYMDLETSFSPIEISVQSTQLDNVRVTSTPQVFVDGLRIYGHRLFGLPPAEPTYVCNWDFDVGRVVGECSSHFVRCIKASLTSFAFSIDDEENALPPLFPLDLHDVVFLRAKVDTIRVWVLVEEAAFLLSSGAIDVMFNDWCGARFSEQMSLNIPNLVFAVVDRSSVGSFEPQTHQSADTYAYFNTSIKVNMLDRRRDFAAYRARQQQHIRLHDQITHRTSWLLHDQSERPPEQIMGQRLDAVAMPVPFMPEPIQRGYPRPMNGSYTPSGATSTIFSEQDYSRDKSYGYSQENHRNMHTTKMSSDTWAEYSGRSVFTSWAMPKFNLYKVQPNDQNVPPLPNLPLPGRERLSSVHIGPDPRDESGDTAQISLFCNFEPGLNGFFSPEAVYALASLLDEIQPSHPLGVIDSLQSSVIADILKRQNPMPKFLQVLSVSVQLPVCRVRVLSSSTIQTGPSSDNFKGQYDFDLYQLQVYFRTKSLAGDVGSMQPSRPSITAHAAAQSVILLAQGDKLNSPSPIGTCRCKLDDIVFWSTVNNPAKGHLQVQSIDVASSSESVEGLVSLIDRTKQVSDTMAFLFEQASTSSTNRLQSLVYHLTKVGSQYPEPQFLTRPSYVLRAVKEHLRSNDSWKIISRIRNIYKSLPPAKEQQLRTSCINNTISHPSDAKRVVLSSFDKWRTWDLAHVKKSLVMKVIWDGGALGHAEEQKLGENSNMVVLIQTIHLSIDPGPKESSLLIEDISSSVRLMARPGDSLLADKKSDSIVVQNYCSNVSLRVRWELFELVEGLLKTTPSIQPQSIDRSAPQDSNPDSTSYALQLVCVADRGSAVMDGINLRLALRGDSLKGSIIHQANTGTESDATSIVLAADTSSVQLTSLSKLLMSWKFLSPNLFISHGSPMNNHHDWRFAAACKRLLYEVMEDPLGLIQVADRIVGDEVNYILALMDIVGSPADQRTDTSAGPPEVHNFHVATFLDSYQIYISLLPSVGYLIAGDVARMSLSPLANSKFEIDFDIKNNQHTLESTKDGKRRIISSMGIPPINGRILLELSAARTAIDIETSIELVEVDAGAVRNALSAINGPEISHFVEDLNHDVHNLQNHFDRIISHRRSPPPKQTTNPKPDLVYRLSLTLAGIAIHSSALGLRDKDYSANMNLIFGTIQAHAENESAQGIRHAYPEFQIYLSQVLFDIKKRHQQQTESCGKLVLYARVSGTSKWTEDGTPIRLFNLASRGLEVELSAETASMIVDIAAHLQETLRTIDLSQEVKHLRKLRLITSPRRKRAKSLVIDTEGKEGAIGLLDAVYSVDLTNIRLSWLISKPFSEGKEAEDLVFSISKIDLSKKKENAARLRIQDMQLQMVPLAEEKGRRSQNSALLPEAVFNVLYSSENSKWRLAFQAAGKALDIRMTSDSIVPTSLLQRSLASASEKLREANALWVASVPSSLPKKKEEPGFNQLRSLLIDVEFAGAIVSLQERQSRSPRPMSPPFNLGSGSIKYGQKTTPGSVASATLRAPGAALKVRFKDDENGTPTLDAEIKVDASTNTLHPTVVPLVTQMSSSVQDVLGGSEASTTEETVDSSAKSTQPKSITANDPTTILGRCKLNVGLWIRKQEFTLSCQPISRVVATACFEDVNITVNTVQSEEQKRFFAMLIAFNKLQASVKHVYSNESTASFDVDSIVVSMMNSKHVSSSSGISAILKISPTKLHVNAKQVQDFLLFREIWMPADDIFKPAEPAHNPAPDAQAYSVQKYQQMAAAGSFPWNSTLAMDSLDIQLDMGQTVGRSEFTIKNLWVSSKKNSDWEQNLCVGFETIAIQSKGRLSGFVELSQFKARTSIEWPDEKHTVDETPLIQAAIGFAQLQAQVSFEYQPFLVVDVTTFDFFMYNVRNTDTQNDRLVSILEGDKLHIFCTALAASQGLALYQTLQRLVQDKRAAYESSLREVERFIQRKSLIPVEQHSEKSWAGSDASDVKMPISLHTNVAVNLKAVKIGSFPSTLHDNQLFKLEAFDAEAHFAVGVEDRRIHSSLGLTLGQLRVALSSINRPNELGAGDLSVADIIARANDSRGGTILKVPQVIATMETWQTPTSNQIEYIFKSSFEGKVDVGWNYSRIAFIRSMWSNHSRALASRLGKPLPQAAVQITGGPKNDEGDDNEGDKKGQEKITAVVNVPQSRYTYTAIETPIIETPQLRDMGEATPPLEWIGLHRDKLPNITHQIIIVTLMEIAKDVEDAYSKILGSS